MSLNQVTLLGNLTRDPEVRHTNGGMAICRVGLALNKKWKKDGEEKEKTTFVDVTIFGKSGEAFAKFHRKGSQALIVGELNMEEWADKQTGEKRTKLAVIGERWEFVGGKREAGGGADSPQYSPGGSSDRGGQWPTQSAPIAGVIGGGDDTPF